MCGYFCIDFIDFMLKDKSFINLFSPNDFLENVVIILNYFLKMVECNSTEVIYIQI